MQAGQREQLHNSSQQHISSRLAVTHTRAGVETIYDSIGDRTEILTVVMMAATLVCGKAWFMINKIVNKCIYRIRISSLSLVHFNIACL